MHLNGDLTLKAKWYLMQTYIFIQVVQDSKHSSQIFKSEKNENSGVCTKKPFIQTIYNNWVYTKLLCLSLLTDTTHLSFRFVTRAEPSKGTLNPSNHRSYEP